MYSAVLDTTSEKLIELIDTTSEKIQDIQHRSHTGRDSTKRRATEHTIQVELVETICAFEKG